jgi:hypothetical protein
VFVAPNDGGAGLELVGFDAELKERLACLVEDARSSAPAIADAGEPAASEDGGAQPAPEGDAADDDGDGAPEARDPEGRKIARNVYERVRGMSLAEQLKAAHSSDPSERIALERVYGKTVWEALLRNPRLTAPEVARLARLGTLPRPLLEIIVGNGGWLQIAEVRRALLANPRLGTDQILRVLRMLPKHELKLAASMTAYPMAVRNAAKTMLKAE